MERYTEKAKEALILAAEAAEETGSRTVGTEHILVGLMKEGTGTAARVLEAGDVKLERVLELEKKLVSSRSVTGRAIRPLPGRCWKTVTGRRSASMPRSSERSISLWRC